MIAVLVTRPRGRSDVLVQELRQRGYRVHAVPTMQTEPAGLSRQSLAGYDWIVLTSARGVDALAELPDGPRFAAVGPETARALRARGVEPAYVPEHADGRDLGDTLPDVSGKRVALVRASAACADLPDRLRERGAAVDEVIAYRTVEAPAASAELLMTALGDPDLRAVLFASGSAVRGYVTLGGGVDLPAITIGPRTTASAFELGFKVLAEAETQNANGLVTAVARVLPLEVENNA
ncbi:MAG: uroporphyrinogen-III synthase [Candidatus Dormibacteraeota bacterium]|nr:uroporphyrinogen-III synthase [Candidatus Dormibacteraeota bacterium]